MAGEEMHGLVKFVVCHGWPSTKSNQKQLCSIETMLFAPRDGKIVKESHNVGSVNYFIEVVAAD